MWTIVQVTVIVMVTKLVEKNKRKAHHYWPEDTGAESPGKVLELGGGCRVEHVVTTYQGAYFLRQALPWIIIPRRFNLVTADGKTREVVQIHTEEWPDLEAPEEPR